MLQSFRDLNDTDLKTLKNSISWITVLIAGADGNIESQELEWAKKIANIRTYSAPPQIMEFFQYVGEDYSEVLSCVLEESSDDAESRNGELSDKLSQLNDVLVQLEPNYGQTLLTSLKSFANHVAKSSGGFLGMFSKGNEEAKWVDLPMVHVYNS